MSVRMNRRGSILLHQRPRVIRRAALRFERPDRDFREQRGNFKSGSSAMTFLRIVIPFYLLVEHDLFGKPVSTFPDHALVRQIRLSYQHFHESSL
jgi:hypothetical protein